MNYENIDIRNVLEIGKNWFRLDRVTLNLTNLQSNRSYPLDDHFYIKNGRYNSYYHEKNMSFSLQPDNDKVIDRTSYRLISIPGALLENKLWPTEEESHRYNFESLLHKDGYAIITEPLLDYRKNSIVRFTIDDHDYLLHPEPAITNIRTNQTFPIIEDLSGTPVLFYDNNSKMPVLLENTTIPETLIKLSFTDYRQLFTAASQIPIKLTTDRPAVHRRWKEIGAEVAITKPTLAELAFMRVQPQLLKYNHPIDANKPNLTQPEVSRSAAMNAHMARIRQQSSLTDQDSTGKKKNVNKRKTGKRR